MHQDCAQQLRIEMFFSSGARTQSKASFAHCRSLSETPVSPCIQGKISLKFKRLSHNSFTEDRMTKVVFVKVPAAGWLELDFSNCSGSTFIHDAPTYINDDSTLQSYSSAPILSAGRAEQILTSFNYFAGIRGIKTKSASCRNVFKIFFTQESYHVSLLFYRKFKFSQSCKEKSWIHWQRFMF